MINFKLKAHIDESSVSKLLDSLSQEQRNNLTAEDIMWKVSEAYSLNDETYVPIHAIGIKLKNQLSDAESRQVSEQSPLIPLASGLRSGVHYYYYGSQSLEMPSTGSPDWIPRL